MRRRQRKPWIGSITLSAIGAALLLDSSYAARMVEPPPTPLELCIAGEAQQRLCLDPLWREHWRPTCDLCLPSVLRPPSEWAHDHDCAKTEMIASCKTSMAQWPEIWNDSPYRRTRVPLLVAVEGASGVTVLAFGLLLFVRTAESPRGPTERR